MNMTNGSIDFKRRIDSLTYILENSTNTVFLGGAGVSTESGISDFRSENGLYHNPDKRFREYSPQYMLSIECLEQNPQLFFEYYRSHMDLRLVNPNTAHFKLAEMETNGRLAGVVTQNVDGLHQKAGSKNVQEIHGSIWSNHCKHCGTKYNVDYIFDNEEAVPVCAKCGGMVRPDVVLYGESLPEKARQTAKTMINSAETLIIAGTSMEVGSANSLYKQFRGSNLIIINKSPLAEIEIYADIVFHENIGEVFASL